MRMQLACCFLLLVCSAAGARGEQVRLQVTGMPFPEPSSVQATVDAGILGQDDAHSSISGEIVLELLPSAVNAATAQIREMRLTVDEAVSYRVQRFPFPAVTASAKAGALRLNMVEPGEAGDISGGTFVQAENLLAVQGEISTSVQPTPLDLAEQPPVMMDFPEIALEGDRQTLALATAIDTEVLVPVSVGALDTEIFIIIEGALEASGAVPAAQYAWRSVSGGSQGEFLDRARWERAGVTGTESLPAESDAITLHAAATPVTELTLGDAPIVDRALVQGPGDLQLVSGTLALAGADLELQTTVTLQPDAQLVADAPIQLAVGGEAKLVLDGMATEIVLNTGILAGRGSAQQLTVHDTGTLEVDLGAIEQPLTIAESLTMAGELALLPADSFSGSQAILNYGQLDAWREDAMVRLGDLSFARDQDGDYQLHAGNGHFYSLSLGESAAMLDRFAAMAGDTNGDGKVDFADFLRLASAFNQPGDWTQGDFDGNGHVAFPDFLALAANFGKMVAVAVPEPGGWASMLLALTAFCRRCRHSGYRQQKKGPSTCHSA